MAVRRLPASSLLVLVGPSGSGKSTWAAEHFPANMIVSADALRAQVGEGPHDLAASADAFAVLEEIVARRLARRLPTIIDTLGFDDVRRRAWCQGAQDAGVPAFVVAFDVAPALCRSRNRARPDPVPERVLRAQFATWAQLRPRLAEEAFTAVIEPEPTRLVPPVFLAAGEAAARQAAAPRPLRFGLQVSSFTWPGGPAEIAGRLMAIARAAEDVGFASLWVMDHLRQIPQVGPAWHDLLDATTTMGFLAAATTSIRLGVLVHGVTYRNVGLLGKTVASLDVLSGGRANCGLGAGWFEAEHKAFGYRFPPPAERLDLLEDALQALPILWGPGSPAFHGRLIDLPETLCYPRPIQEHIPLLVGGQGEKRTLRLAARYGDACNLFGDPATVAAKLAVLHRHCAELGRDPAEILVTHLGTALCATDAAQLAETIDRLRPPRQSAERFAAATNAGTVEDHIGRFRELREAGIEHAIVALADLDGPATVERFRPVIAAFS